MRFRALIGTTTLLATLAAAAVRAQTPAPTPEPEPAVQTSSDSTGSSSVPAPATSTPAAPSRGGSRAASPKGASGDAAAKTQDRMELDTTQISGNRELPKVMYVVPWRKADLGDVAGRPPNSLLDEALTPVDRDVFRRENRYYAALESSAAPSKSQPGAAPGKAAIPEVKDEK